MLALVRLGAVWSSRALARARSWFGSNPEAFKKIEDLSREAGSKNVWDWIKANKSVAVMHIATSVGGVAAADFISSVFGDEAPAGLTEELTRLGDLLKFTPDEAVDESKIGQWSTDNIDDFQMIRRAERALGLRLEDIMALKAVMAMPSSTFQRYVSFTTSASRLR